MATISADAGRLQGFEQVAGKASLQHLLEAKSEGDTMTEPTDAELEALAVEHEAFGFGLADKQGLSTHGFDPDGLRSFARAVLAKWGTPPAVVGEPIGHLYCGGLYGDELADWEIVADQHQCDKLNEHHGALGKEAKLPIYTAPQPTQAQAGAVPLTDEQIDSLLWKYGYDPDDEHMAAMLKEAHGIKGGQHGTE